MGRKRGGGGDGGGGDGGESPLAAPHCPPSPTTLLDSSPLYPSIHIPESWSDAANSVALATASPPVVFICGPKNSGKTTFSRYLVNTLLPRYKNVAYLDTDVGQPEFTPPGCLSLHVLQEHTTDLKVMSLKTPVKCVFFGDISSKRDPKIYLDGIFSLYDYFLKEYCQASDIANIRIPILPLVINTAGWVKGAGYEQLVEMLRCITTTHVVQIRTSSQSKNLPRGFFWLDRNQDVATNLIEIYAARKDSLDRTVLTQKPSRDLRDIRIIAYFHQCVPHDMDVSTYKDLAYVLASIPPYEVPISTIKVQHLHCQVRRQNRLDKEEISTKGNITNYIPSYHKRVQCKTNITPRPQDQHPVPTSLLKAFLLISHVPMFLQSTMMILTYMLFPIKKAIISLQPDIHPFHY